MSFAQATVSPRITNPRKRQLTEEVEASLDELERWRKCRLRHCRNITP